MIYLEVLCEGSSDVPALKEILTRGLKLEEGKHFRIHPHQGKGKLPQRLYAKPAAGRNTLLGSLPIKLRNYGRQAAGDYETAVLVVIDADDDNCKQLKGSLLNVLEELDTKPSRVLFRIAVEETESWFIADSVAIKAAYSHTDLNHLRKFEADAICGAWERLAEAIGLDPARHADKSAWAAAISPHLNLDSPKSPSLRCLISGIPKLLNR